VWVYVCVNIYGVTFQCFNKQNSAQDRSKPKPPGKPPVKPVVNKRSKDKYPADFALDADYNQGSYPRGEFTYDSQNFENGNGISSEVDNSDPARTSCEYGNVVAM
jgi:hypothetical protein